MGDLRRLKAILGDLRSQSRPLQELNDLSSVVKPTFTAVHINVRSLSQHFQDMCNFLDSSAFAFDVIGLSETLPHIEM